MEESMENQLDIFSILGETQDLEVKEEQIKEVTVLDKEESTRTTSKVLEEYTDLDVEVKKLESQIEEIKATNPEIFKKIDELNESKSSLFNKQSELKSELVNTMKLENLTKVSGTKYNVTYVAETVRANFDRKSFEAKYPVLCKQFIKESPVSAYVKISEIKKKGE